MPGIASAQRNRLGPKEYSSEQGALLESTDCLGLSEKKKKDAEPLVTGPNDVPTENVRNPRREEISAPASSFVEFAVAVMPGECSGYLRSPSATRPSL